MAPSIWVVSQSRIKSGIGPALSLAKNVTAVASCSVPVLDAVSITANTPSQRLGWGRGWPSCKSFSREKKATPAQSTNSARYSCAYTRGSLSFLRSLWNLSRRSFQSARLSLRSRLGRVGLSMVVAWYSYVAHGLVLLFGNRHQGPCMGLSSIMGFEDEAEQSFCRPCRLTGSRSKRTYE